jgi:hypothetical protein
MSSMTIRLVRAGLALALAAPIAATAQPAPPARHARPAGGPAIVSAAAPQTCDAMSPDSPPARAWWAAERWRYATDADATAAYLVLVNNDRGGSPWPAWFLPPPNLGTATPPLTVLPVGTRFQMALAVGQATDAPGGWGTFDYIADVEDVREFLAVTHAFKANIDRVVTYEVTRMMPVLIGSAGPQVDTQSCEYFPGRWSQFNMLPAYDQRMDYLKIVEVRAIH